jgi:hypothetical protein
MIAHTSLIWASLLLDFAKSFGTAYSGMTTSSILLVTRDTVLTTTKKWGGKPLVMGKRTRIPANGKSL